MLWDSLWDSAERSDDDDLDLERGEVVIDRASDVYLETGERLEDFVLTNRHLILSKYERSGLLSMQQVYLHCPLNELRGEDGRPEVYLSKTKGPYAVTLVFGKETLRLRFGLGRKSVQETWAKRIAKAATQQMRTAGKAAGAEDGALVTRPCIGCQAPITGRKGHAVVCDYCGTRQTL